METMTFAITISIPGYTDECRLNSRFVAAMEALRLRFGGSFCWALIGATVALAIAVLMPARADAFGTFTNGVLTISGGEGKIVPRCASDGEITVSGAFVDNGPPTAAT